MDDDRADLISFLVWSRRGHVPDLNTEEEAECEALADRYITAGRLSDDEVLRYAALRVGARIKAIQDRYGSPTWIAASADQRRRRRALGWTPPNE